MSFAFVDVSSIFDSLADSLMHPAWINQERHVVQAEEIYSEVWYKCSSSPRRLRRPRAARFIKSGTCKQISRAIKKIFIFPPKNLQKIRVHCCFIFDSISNIFTNLLNFPAKIRMRQFFFFLICQLISYDFIFYFSVNKVFFFCVLSIMVSLFYSINHSLISCNCKSFLFLSSR